VDVGATAEVTFRLHADLYPLAAIEKVALAFARFGRISVESSASYHSVRIAPAAGVSGDRLALEFANHALSGAAAGPSAS
jgi:hypothetical protein